uniref:glycine N-acyltransferase-like n=1 Tax=Semicossyphus pulcher TaxID=241346 RepID=UPI0037E82805
MELTGEQLKEAETQLKRYLPRSQQESDLFKDILFFAKNETILEETLRNPSVIDWNRYLCLGFDYRHRDLFEAVASEKDAPSKQLSVCHMMTLEDVSNLPIIDSSGISLSSLDESHIGLVNQMWKFGNDDRNVGMLRDMITHFPSCCVLDAEAKPVAWILVYSKCAMGVLYTLPEHRGKGYAKVLISTMSKRLHAEGYPVFCFIEEENTASYELFRSLGFTEDPSYRAACFVFNDI